MMGRHAAGIANSRSDDDNVDNNIGYQLAQGRFVDLTTTIEGEHLLERLFLLTTATTTTTTTINNDDSSISSSQSDGETVVTSSTPSQPNKRIIQYAITTLQSLLIYGMQIGVKGSEESQKKMVRHLFRRTDTDNHNNNNNSWISHWDSECIRRLKFYRDTTLGKQLLGQLIRKRTSKGAYELLVEMGVWDRHTDVALLRSGFPVRFTDDELVISMEAEKKMMKKEEEEGGDYEYYKDPDEILGIRCDLREQKIYTIDSASTLDIDDGIAVEVLGDDSGHDDHEATTPRHRYWIHIADVDRWAPRGSKLLSVAERRGTSLYLPTMTLCMFPPNMSSEVMSLHCWEDKYALSLGVELNEDGSIDESSIIVTPSIIQVDYRLTYDQVDEMLDEGVGYLEEWQLGALLAAATKRRSHRVNRGSTEGMVPFPIPKGMVTANYDSNLGDYEISLKIETTHNSGANITTEMELCDAHYDPYCTPVSSSQLIVTEMMILAGEAIGKWQMQQPTQEREEVDGQVQLLPNVLKLPFRRQPAPDFKSREKEKKQMDFLYNMGKRYPHAWYARRFFNRVDVSEEPGPHFGMGLDCYVQWSSPIRRITDLQSQEGTKEIDPIDYTSGLGMIFAGRPVQSSSSNYWLFEYIRRLVNNTDEEVMFESVVLGCTNKDRFQYAVYIYELGLEHRYLSEIGKLDEGKKLWLKVASVNPKMELLTFSLASRSGGIPKSTSAPAA
ncbi:hypothetical protein ACHAWC_010570 [Mediolabrus comicus]